MAFSRCSCAGLPEASHAAEIVHAIGQVRIFLDFTNDHARPNGVLRASASTKYVSPARTR